MKLPIGQYDKSVYKEDLQDKLKRRKLVFFILLLTVPLAIVLMETIGANYTKPEHSKSITEPVAYVNAGTKIGTAFLTGSKTLLTARHVVEDLEIGDEVELLFMNLDPQISTTAIVKWKEGSSEVQWESDFAVLKLVDPSVLPDDISILNLGDSDNIFEDDEIAAIGYPAGMFSFTKGIISSTTIKTVEGEYDLIKIDCQIHSGSSGGPIVLTESEEVIGIAEAGFEGEFKGINFASKINRLIEAVEMAGIDIYE
jgi:S1-C subfamily serine protease